MFRRSESHNPAEAPDQFALWVASLDPRWQPPVYEAMASRDRFVAIVSQVPPGPTRDRLDGLRPVLDQAVQRVAETVWRASNANNIAAGLDVEGATAQLKAARRELDTLRSSGADTTAVEARVQALAERHRAVNQAINLAEDAGATLSELNVRLDTAVARAATIVMRSSQDDGLDEISNELTDVVSGLTALDEALVELDG